MEFNENKLINVLNYNENPVAIATHQREYLCSPAEGENPSITPLTFSEIESLNSSSNAFKIGTLRFPSEVEADIYEALRITDWEDILTNEAIEDIILHPSLDGLTKIVKIQNASLFERVRGVFFSLKNSNQYDISTRVEKVITARYKELCNGKIKTKIILTPKDTIPITSSEDVNALKAQNEEMKNQMLQMQQMMEQMMKMQQAQSESDKEAEDNEKKVETETKKKPGRPRKVQ